ncbi:MAG: hypothetical protein M3Q22_05975 [Actinomycetota bacterium]|nr:hypothetical protein [Actinomycetota bacterium]
MSTTKPAAHDCEPYLDDPERFAAHLYAELAAAGEARILDPAAMASQAFKDAISTLKQAHPGEVGVGLSVTIADEAGFAWASESHAAGVRFGVVAETLRRALLGSDD